VSQLLTAKKKDYGSSVEEQVVPLVHQVDRTAKSSPTT